MRESESSKSKYHNWDEITEQERQHALGLQDVKAREEEILSIVFRMLEKKIGLTQNKLVPLELAAIRKKAHEVAEINSKLSKDLQGGLINKETYELTLISSPLTEVLHDYYRSYGQEPPAEFIDSRSFGNSKVYWDKFLKSKLLAARRERIKPFLDEPNDVLE